MRQVLLRTGSGRFLGRRLVVLLLLFVLGAAALPAVQAQGTNMYIYLFSRGGSVSEDSNRDVRFSIGRMSLGAGYGQAHYRLCFSGSATLDVDYFVRSNVEGRFTPSGNCITDYFRNGYQRMWYYIVPIHDNDDESNETVAVTLSQDSGNPFPGGYYLPSYYSRATFRINDND